jgi:hypothetical protein
MEVEIDLIPPSQPIMKLPQKKTSKSDWIVENRKDSKKRILRNSNVYSCIEDAKYFPFNPSKY